MKIIKIKTGDVILYKSNSLLSKLIRFFSGKYSHASIVFDSWYKCFVAEADKQGVIPNSIEYSIKGCEVLILRPRFEFDPKSLDQLVTSELGKHRYNYFLLIVMQLIYQLSNKKIWLYWGKNGAKLRRTVCGQFVAYIWNEYDKAYFIDWAKATPQSLYESELFEKIEITL